MIKEDEENNKGWNFFYFPIEHLSVFHLLVTESEERLVFSEMFHVLDCLQKLSMIVRNVGTKRQTVK